MIFIQCALLFLLRLHAADDPALAAQTAKLKELVRASPRLALQQTELNVRPPAPGFALDYPSSIAVDKAGLLWLFQRGDKADPVIAVNRQGKIIRSWGKGLYKIPHSIRIDPAGNIWTVDAASSMVYKHTPEGRKLLEISVGGQPVKPNTQFTGTTDICFAPNGHLYIADGYGNARILEYNAEGRRLREWGGPGTGPGQFHLPHGITVDPEGTLYVADRENGRIQRFDLNGKYLGEWGHLGKTFSITYTGGDDLWIGTQPRTSPNGKDGWLMKIHRRTGRILGYIESDGTHSAAVTAEGHPVAGARPGRVLRFQPR
ncbi:MAG: peptidyl-alpha-hydroxyglycine alpha-amidating lyase family protein [Bryobacteraceae bacterium]|nr:peptidyl-alpha-hydroxyglycine alpha-amidating lyase family protein [Bryobacteraceae bacterium]